MIREALNLLAELWLPGFEYKKAGVMLADISNEQDVQLSIMETQLSGRSSGKINAGSG
jgi:hypothetical protein